MTETQTGECVESWCRSDHDIFGPDHFALAGELPIADGPGSFTVGVHLRDNGDAAHDPIVSIDGGGSQRLRITPAVARSLAAMLVRAADLLEVCRD